jgi:hypothetical protein
MKKMFFRFFIFGDFPVPPIITLATLLITQLQHNSIQFLFYHIVLSGPMPWSSASLLSIVGVLVTSSSFIVASPSPYLQILYYYRMRNARPEWTDYWLIANGQKGF